MTSRGLNSFGTLGTFWPPTAPSTYCGVDYNEHHRCAHQILIAGVIFVCQHIVELAGEDAHLVNDQLLWRQKKKDVLAHCWDSRDL